VEVLSGGHHGEAPKRKSGGSLHGDYCSRLVGNGELAGKEDAG
jgi:hypothetical protein